MRWVLWALLGAVALAAVAVGAAALLLPSLVDTPSNRARLQAAVEKATGEPLRYAALRVGVLPPRVALEGPVLGDAADGPELVRAERIDLVLAPWPLLSRRVVVDSLRVDGADVHWLRVPAPYEADEASPDGAASPPAADGAGAGKGAQAGGAADAASRPPAAAGPEGVSPGSGAGTGKAAQPPGPSLAESLGVRSVDVRDSRFTLEDRTVEPPVTVTVDGIALRARADGEDDPIRFELEATPSAGGSLSATGTAGLRGDVEADVALDGVAVSPLSGYLGPEGSLAGRVSGTVGLRFRNAAPESIEASLELADGALALEGVSVDGPLALSTRLEAGEAGLGGRFEVDATRASLVYQDAFRKPPGTAAKLEGRLVPRNDGTLAVHELRVRIRNFEAQGRLDTAPRPRLELSAPAFDVAGWDVLVPALSGRALSGRVALDALELAADPPTVLGALVLEEVGAELPEAPPLVVAGRLEGDGDAVRSRGLALRVAQQGIPLELALTGLAGDRPALALASRADGLDVAKLAAAFGDTDRAVEGPLALDARLRTPLGGDEPVTDTLSGTVRFDLGPGTFRGRSLLERVFALAGPIGRKALDLGQAFGGRDVKRLYRDRFETVAATLDVDGGLARFDDLRLVYRDYRVDLRGSVRLADQALDATGRIRITGLADGVVELPITHVGGTLGEPDVKLSPEATAAVASALAGARLQGEVKERIGDVIEKATEGGGALGEVLQGLMGRGRR